MATLSDVTRLTRVEIPDGTYHGTWGGYRVKFTVDGIEYGANSDVGVRTPYAPCLVTVCRGKLTVRAV